MPKYRATYKETSIYTIEVDAPSKAVVKERILLGFEDSTEPIEYHTYGAKIVLIEKVED